MASQNKNNLNMNWIPLKIMLNLLHQKYKFWDRKLLKKHLILQLNHKYRNKNNSNINILFSEMIFSSHRSTSNRLNRVNLQFLVARILSTISHYINWYKIITMKKYHNNICQKLSSTRFNRSQERKNNLWNFLKRLI